MNGLYKGKYLIVVCDKDDYIKDVACSPRELVKNYKSKNVANGAVSHAFNNPKNNTRMYFIDCTEKHDDIFAEEDEKFLQFIVDTRQEPERVKAERLGVSLRTYMRYKSKGTLYKLENKQRR